MVISLSGLTCCAQVRGRERERERERGGDSALGCYESILKIVFKLVKHTVIFLFGSRSNCADAGRPTPDSKAKELKGNDD